MIEVIPFTPAHREGVIDVILPIQRDEFGIPVTLADQPDLLDIPAYYVKNSGNFWVAVSNGQVVGTISLLDIGNAQGALRKMFVRREFRGADHRVAAKLLQTLIEWSEVRRVREIFLGTTAQFLAAHRFYEKNGFREIEKSKLPPAFPVMSVDTKFYLRSGN